MTHVNDDGVANGLFDATRSFDVSLKMARSKQTPGHFCLLGVASSTLNTMSLKPGVFEPKLSCCSCMKTLQPTSVFSAALPSSFYEESSYQ